MEILYEMSRECRYEGVDYKIVEVLNDLLLVVKKDDYQNSKFPLQTYIIPEEFSEEL